MGNPIRKPPRHLMIEEKDETAPPKQRGLEDCTESCLTMT